MISSETGICSNSHLKFKTPLDFRLKLIMQLLMRLHNVLGEIPQESNDFLASVTMTHSVFSRKCVWCACNSYNYNV